MNTLTAEKREAIVRILTKVLTSEGGVVFAYLHGSFVADSAFRDIDVFVYTSEGEDPFVFPVKVKEKLSDAVSEAGIKSFVVDDFDVKIINDAPYDIVIDILCEGRLLADKDPDFRNNYIERISNEYRANYFVLDEAYGEDR
ncbi:MAG: nucleotidyltransferase domain-containing protein [Candidatus Scalindua sp.]